MLILNQFAAEFLVLLHNKLCAASVKVVELDPTSIYGHPPPFLLLSSILKWLQAVEFTGDLASLSLHMIRIWGMHFMH